MAKKLLKRRVLKGQNNLITDNAATTRHYSIFSPEEMAAIERQLLSDVDQRTDHSVSTTDNTIAQQEQQPRKKLNLREETQDNSQSNASTRAAILNQGEEYLADMMREQGTERSDATRYYNQMKEEAQAADEYHKYDYPGTVYEGKGKVSYTLPEITVNAKGPTDWMGIPYAAHTSPLALRMEADRNQAGMDMYNAMLGIASLPYAGAFMPGTWLKWGLPKLGVSRVPTAVAGWGANTLQSGYFGYHGAKGLYDAWQHPETLSNPYTQLRLGADALMAIAPFGDVIGGVSKLPVAGRYVRRYYGTPALNYLSNTRVGQYIPQVSQMLNARFVAPSLQFMKDNVVTPVGRELNRNVRIPLLWQLRQHNVPYHVANWFANREGKIRGWWNDVDYMDPNNDIAKGIRQSLYRRWNSKAGYLQRTRSWEPTLKETALNGIDTNINIFNKYWKPSREKMFGRKINVGKAGDYLEDLEFGYLPYTKNGVPFILDDGSIVGAWSTQRLPTSTRKSIYINGNLPQKEYHYSVRDKAIDMMHEGEHNFRNDPQLIQEMGFPYFGPFSGIKVFDDVYLSHGQPVYGTYSYPAEKAATNAEVRYFLGIKPDEAATVPTHRIIRLNSEGNIESVFDDMVNQTHASNVYKRNYMQALREAWYEELKNNSSSGLSKEEIFSKFAEKYADSMRKALQFGYRKGGKI